MQIQNAKSWCRHSKRLTYGASFLMFLLTTAILYTGGEAFFSANPYKFYFIFGAILAFFFGFWPALLYVMAGSFYANFYFVKPYGEFVLGWDYLQQFLLNLLLGLTCIVLIEFLQRERFKSRLLLMVSESRYLILLHRDNRLLNEIKRKK